MTDTGAHHGDDQQQRVYEWEQSNDDVTPTLAQHYAEHSARLKRLGTPIGNNDLWVAAHALSLNCILVTHNTQEFNRVEGLMIEDWVSSAQSI